MPAPFPYVVKTQEGQRDKGVYMAKRKVEKQDFPFKTVPFKHQKKVFLRSRNKESFALFMEQGTGKSKVIVDNAAWLYMTAGLQALIVIAPNGVHRNWVVNELPDHMPDCVPYTARFWDSQKVQTKKFQTHLNEIWDFDGLKIFTINIDAVLTKWGKAFLQKFLLAHKTMLVVDESQTIKNHKAKRSKASHRLARKAEYRRILTGTPATISPLDIYSQFELLDPHIFGFGSFYTFRNHFAETEKEYNRKAGREYTVVTGFKNIPEMKKIMKPYTYRVTKEECLDLPPKLYSMHYVDMSKEQARIYKDLKEELIAEFDGYKISVPLMLTKILRLQQVLGGFMPQENAPGLLLNKDGGPRLKALLTALEGTQGKAIIWCRFVDEIKLITKKLQEVYGREAVVQYYGKTKSDSRVEAIKNFQDPKSPVRFFVGQPASGGRGLTLHQASAVIYYSNDFSLENRLQSEDRAHRIGLQHAVTYIDLCVPDTVDEKIVTALRKKKELADLITGDSPREWL